MYLKKLSNVDNFISFYTNFIISLLLMLLKITYSYPFNYLVQCTKLLYVGTDVALYKY